MGVDSKDRASFDSIFETGETDIRAKVDVKPVPSPLPSAVPAPLDMPMVLPLPPAPTRPPPLPPPLPPPVAAPAPSFPPADLDPVLPPTAAPRRPIDLDPVLPAIARPTVDLDPALPPEKKTTAKRAANLDPPLAVAAEPKKKEAASAPAAPALARLRGLPLSPLFAAAAFVVGVVFVFVLLEPGGGASRAQVARSEAARAALIPQARSDVEEAVVAVARRLDPGLRLLVVRDPQAFMRVLPDGWLVVSDGLLERLQSDAEWAALVAHATAHHRAGRLNDDDDANAGQVFTPAEEDEADREAIASLGRAGFRARALGDVQDRLKKTAWSAQHPHSGQALLGSPAGDEDKGAWAKNVLEVLHPAKRAARPTVPVRIQH